MKLHAMCLVLVFGLVSCVLKGPRPAQEQDVVQFMPKTHESMLLEDYMIEIDGVDNPVLFKRGTPSAQTLKVNGHPHIGENGSVEIAVLTRKTNKTEWSRLTSLRVFPIEGREIILNDSMKIICE